jgi:hypothetical protein
MHMHIILTIAGGGEKDMKSTCSKWVVIQI